MLRAAAFLLALMVVSSASAVDLGTLTLRSGFAEPLQAVVPLENPDGVRLGTIEIEPASPATYERLDIERPAAIDSLTTELRGSGDIVLRTETAVSQEVIDLVLVVTWPNGRIVRDYVITLEPPVFTEEQRRALRRFEPEALTDPGPVEPAEPTPAPEPAPQEPSAPATITVADSDTLWEIALSVRTNSDHTPQQIMLALQDLSPQAFINGNINRLRADVTLRVPSAQDIESRSVREALAEVARQNAALAAATPAAEQGEPVAEPTGEVDSPEPQTSDPERDPDGFLEVVTEASDSAEEADTEGAAATEIRRLQNELAIQEEVNDELRRQYEEQQSRLLELEEQVQLLDRLVELQNQSAAELQSLSEQQNQASTDAGPDASDETEESTAMGWQERVDQGWVAVRDWLRQPVNAGLVIAALVVALLLALLMRRRQEPDPEPEDGELDIDDSLLEDDDDFPAPEEPDFPESPRTANKAEQTPTSPPHGRTVPEVIENADMHMAFQNYGEAEQVLREALAHNPGEPALAHKLLDVFAETGDRGAFEALADEYMGSPESLEPLYRKLADTEVRDAGEPTPADHQALNEPDDDAWDDLSDSYGQESARSQPDEEPDFDFSALDDVDDRTLLGDENDEDSTMENPRSSQDDRELLEALDDLMDDIDQGELESGTEDRSREQRRPEETRTDDEPSMADDDDAPYARDLSADDLPGDDWDKEFDFLDGEDEMDTKLDLARAYMDMGDHQGAREILQEVQGEGSSAQKESAEHLLGQLR